jgi:hypothetical protein
MHERRFRSLYASSKTISMCGRADKTAWFMTHRIREAMKSGTLPPIGGPGVVAEIDETYAGPKRDETTKARG